MQTEEGRQQAFFAVEAQHVARTASLTGVPEAMDVTGTCGSVRCQRGDLVAAKTCLAVLDSKIVMILAIRSTTLDGHVVIY
jgi:hypothetical protein